jgi:rhodanese-related sulfurtransferase
MISAMYASVEEMLAAARATFLRLDPMAARAAVDSGAWLVDIRPHAQRARDGEIPRAVVVDRVHLEWRLHPASEARLDVALPDRRWIVVCSEGYSSSLAAAALVSLGVDATDVVGGFQAWQAAGLPTVPGGTPTERISPAPDDAALPSGCRPGSTDVVPHEIS